MSEISKPINSAQVSFSGQVLEGQVLEDQVLEDNELAAVSGGDMDDLKNSIAAVFVLNQRDGQRHQEYRRRAAVSCA